MLKLRTTYGFLATLCLTLSCSSESPTGGGDLSTTIDTNISIDSTTAPPLTSDFVPAEGAEPKPANASDPSGPWSRRLMLATSQDGLAWQKKNEILVDQGDAPSMVADKDGTIFVYYVTEISQT